MFTRILVPLDGSDRAENAIPVAAKIAKANGGTVILLRVETIPMMYAPAPVPPLSVETLETERAAFAGYLSTIAGRPVLVNVPTETLVLIGSPAQKIFEAISTKRADLVVMTSHGRTGVSRWMLGSVAEQIARHAPVPVLVLREPSPVLTGHHADVEHLERILVSLDGSALAEAALKSAASLAEAISAEPAVHLVLVVSPYEATEANMPEALAVAGAKDYLTTVATRLKQESPALRVTWSVGVGLDVAETLIRIAERGDDTEGAGVFGGCDVIAIATHGRTGFARWALGSITERVLHGTKLPLLITRPAKVAAAEHAEAPGYDRRTEIAATGTSQGETGKTNEADQRDADIPAWSALF